MAADFDATDFIDDDSQQSRQNPFHAPAKNPASEGSQRAPTREEVDSKLTELHSKLAQLKQEQGEIERERAAFEETRRRQMEFTTGREELIRDLSRGIQLLEEKELATRRDAEQMAQSLRELKEDLAKLQAVQESSWTRENLSTELSRALGLADHARMEWNTARLKFPVLTAPSEAGPAARPAAEAKPAALLAGLSLAQIVRLGLALTWPVALAGLAIFLALLLRR
jgi:hypothetical protein